jgi:hypothetical protein
VNTAAGDVIVQAKTVFVTGNQQDMTIPNDDPPGRNPYRLLHCALDDAISPVI